MIFSLHMFMNNVSDIFISYSSKDKEKADQLSELLAPFRNSALKPQHSSPLRPFPFYILHF